MNIQKTYEEILLSIQQGGRGLKRYSSQELEELNELLKRPGYEIDKVLCLVEHSANLYPDFEPQLLKLLSTELPGSSTIFALNCARKHIIQSRFQRGVRLTYEFLELLKKLLHSKNPEIVEWTLRTIEECGAQGVYFRQEFDKIKPPPWKWFNAHQRAVREIIALLERRWSPIERSKQDS